MQQSLYIHVSIYSTIASSLFLCELLCTNGKFKLHVWLPTVFKNMHMSEELMVYMYIFVHVRAHAWMV